MPLGDRRVRGFDFRKFRALLFVACSKEFVIRMGTQTGTASPIHFAHARRHHQIPAHKRERGGVTSVHDLAFITRRAVADRAARRA